MKALVGAFNQEKALGPIVKTGCGTDGALHSTSEYEYAMYQGRMNVRRKTAIVSGSSIEYAAVSARSSASCKMDINIEAAGVEKLA